MPRNENGSMDARTIKACRAALQAALATVQHWSQQKAETDAELKSTLARFIVKHAADGVTDPKTLRRRALESYFLREA
jgi:hypothetical protein